MLYNNIFLFRLFQFILSCSILIFLHELGHFIFAKLFNIHVEKFYLFFNPFFSLFKKKIGNTIYGIGWIPLGGYVKISNLFEKNNKKNKFSSKEVLKRIIIIIGGILMNFLISILIFSFLFFKNGKIFLPIEKVKDGIWVNRIGYKIGFKNGDKILSIDGKEIKDFNKIVQNIILGKIISLNRNGKKINIILDKKKKSIIFSQKELEKFIYPRLPNIIDLNYKKNELKKLGFQNGDKILSVNYKPVFFVDQIINILKEKKNKVVAFSIKRNNKILKKNILVNEHLFSILNFKKIYDIYNPYSSYRESLYESFKYSLNFLKNQFFLLKEIANPNTQAYNQIGSFFSIEKTFPTNWNLYTFLFITGCLSISLSFINLLPIPSLDGGYILIYLFELIFRRNISQKIVELIMFIGFIIIILLSTLIIFWDSLRNF